MARRGRGAGHGQGCGFGVAGAGWGGPAKGAGTGARPAFASGNGYGATRNGATAARHLAKEERAARLLEILEGSAEHAYARLPETNVPGEVASLVNAVSAACERGHRILIPPTTRTELTGANAGPFDIEDRKALAEARARAEQQATEVLERLALAYCQRA